MLRFIRRVFMLLVLFVIVFLIYRYINPGGASEFIKNVRFIPDKISDFVGGDKDDNISITSSISNISGDVNYDETVVETQYSGDEILFEDVDSSGDNMEDDLTWLEELNLEIDEILGDNVSTGDNLTGELITDEVEDNLSGDVDDIDADISSGSDIIVENVPVVPESDPVGLTDVDYQQIKNIFGNLVE